jgi:regulator of nonsense transcripts 2
MRLLVQLMNYFPSIFLQTLYSLITFGCVPGTSWNPLDPPDNLFRLKLTCILLDICGTLFITGAAKKKLDSFMLYFQVGFGSKVETEMNIKS